MSFSRQLFMVSVPSFYCTVYYISNFVSSPMEFIDEMETHLTLTLRFVFVCGDG